MTGPPKCKRRPARGGGGPLLGGSGTRFSYPKQAIAATAPVIAIAPEAFGFGYDVIVRNAPAGCDFDREFPSYSEARAHADAVRALRGWIVIDESGEAR